MTAEDQQAMSQLRAQVLTLQRSVQEMSVRVQNYASKVQSLQDAVALIVGPLPITPKLSLNLRPNA